MNQLTQHLFIGDLTDGLMGPLLKENGIQAIVNATTSEESVFIGEQPTIPYLKLNHSDGVPWKPEELDRFLGFMCTQAYHDRRVLVHCGAGISRSSSLCILWLLVNDKIESAPWGDIEDFVRQSRGIIMPHHELKTSILQYLGVQPPLYQAP